MGYELAVGNAKPIKFRSAEQFLEWCKNEMEFWNWIQDVDPQQMGNFNVRIRNTMQSIMSVISHPDNQGYQNGLAGELEALQHAISESQYIYSKSILAEFITQEMRIDKSFAAKIVHVATRTDHENLPAQKGYHSAANALFDFERGITKRGAASSVKAIEQARAELEALLHRETEESQARLNELAELVAARAANAEEWKNALSENNKKLIARESKFDGQIEKLFSNTQLELDQTTQQLVSDTSEDIENFKQALKEEIALKEPIDYWGKKAADHEKAKNRWGRVFTIYVLTVIVLLATFVLGFDGGIQGFIASWKDSGIGAVATFAGLIGIGMVIARVLYRLFASQLHLWNDARERVTMIQTYLALAAEGHAKEEFLGALMQRLFSPSTDGIVKSDLGSVGIFDAATKIAGGK